MGWCNFRFGGNSTRVRRFGAPWALSERVNRKACGFSWNLRTPLPADMVKAMHALALLLFLALSSSIVVGQASTAAPAFDVASVKSSQRLAGPDYNNQLTYSPTGITARNVTLK